MSVSWCESVRATRQEKRRGLPGDERIAQAIDTLTHGVTIRVAVSYLAEQSDPSINRWFWSYHVRIENGGARSIQLLSRSWKITDGRGVVHEVQGEGVVGEMPLIAPDGSFDYVSGCPLDTPSGSMSGSYRMVDEDGGTFDVDIPKFALLAPVN